MSTIVIGVTSHTSIAFHQQLAVRLSSIGHQVHIISAGGPLLQQLPECIFTHELKMARDPNLLVDIRSFVDWLKLLSKIKPDLILVGTPKASLLGITSAAVLGVKSRLYFVHGLRLETATGFFQRILLLIERLTAVLSTHVVAVSSSLRKEMIEVGVTQPEKIIVLGSGSTQGVDLQRFRPAESSLEKNRELNELGLDPFLPTIGFVGRLTADKGVVEFKDSLIDLDRKGLSFQVLIVGAVEDEHGVTMIDDLQSSGIKTVAVGHVGDTAPYFRAMDVFCLPSYREGLGNVILEAFSAQVPVVATDVTGIRDLLQDQKTGLLVPPRDSLALASALRELLQDPSYARELAVEARRLVESKYDENKVVDMQVNFIEDCIKSVKHRG